MAKSIKSRARLPRAGEHQIGNMTEYWCLAPLPIPINTPPVPYYTNLQKANQTTLDLGSDDYWGTEFAFRLGVGAFIFFFSVVFIIHISIIFSYMQINEVSLLQSIYDMSIRISSIYIIVLLPIILLHSSAMIWAIYKNRPSAPIRFNREKRQAACQLDNGDVYFIDWERINAQVEQAAIMSTRYIIKPAQLSLYFPHPNGKDAFALTLFYGTELSALGEWEAIRRFMDNGLDDLKQHLYTPQELANQKAIEAERGTLRYYNQQCASHPFGSVPYFYALKAKKKLEKDSYRMWCFWQLCSGWTLPCHMAAWLNKLPTKGFNQQVLDWSKPIPKQQWQHPSEELTKQSDKLIQAYAQGISFKQYFTQTNNEQ